jgi:hypothetical protein
MDHMKRLALVALFAVACGAAQVQAQTLALAYKSGATFKYALHSTATESINEGGMAIPLNFELTGAETVTVKSVDAAGTADLTIALSNLSIKSTTGGVTNTTTGMPSPTIDMKIAPDGRIVSINGTDLAGNPFGAFSPTTGGFISAVLPDSAVKPGDTWSKDYDQANTMGSGSIHVATKSKYLRNESLQGVTAAVVETTSTATYDLTLDLSKLIAGAGAQAPPIPQGAFTGLTVKGTSTSDVTSWIDPNGHRVMKTHMTGTSDSTLNMDAASGSSASGSPAPGMPMSFAIQGKETTDITPA